MSNGDGKGLPRYGEFPKNERPGHAELDAEMDDALARDDHKDRPPDRAGEAPLVPD